jgi:hypothetical protein
MSLLKKVKKIATGVVNPLGIGTGGPINSGLGGAAQALMPAAPPPPQFDPSSGQADYDRIKSEYGHLADQYTTDAGNYREKLAHVLADTGQQTFQMENPYILQDLNSRGLFTSPTAVNQAQADALKEIALDNSHQLSGFDTDVFNNTQNIRSTGTGASLQRLFDVQDQDREERLASYLAKRKSRDSLVSSLLTGAATIVGAYLGGPVGAAAGASVGSALSSNRRSYPSYSDSLFDDNA